MPLIFPASKEDVTDALVKLGLPVTADNDKYYINNMLIKGNIPFFCDDNSVDEMNYLARLISNFDEEQTKKFIAAVDYKNFESVADVINIAHNTDYYSIMPDVENWRDVGKVMAERAGFSKAQIEMFGDYFNFAQYAKSLENDKGKRILQSKDMYIESGQCEWKDKYHGNFKELPRECVVSVSGLSRLGEKAKEQIKKPSIRQRLKDLKKEQGGSRREQTHKPPSQEL
ncbi:MAG: antirestriction protein ArdA [Oscillospiraceae bacterium]|nr:antirestriction protein ArdA [Oscillospiraceae bacterium]